MAVKFTNNAKTTLAASITDVATTATVTDGSVFPTLGAGEYFYCTFDDTTNNEIVKVTARSGNTLTIVRGVDNTTARAFSSGDAAELRATAGLLTDIQENIAAKSANQTVYNTTTASSATSYDIGIDPSVEANAMVFLNGVMQHHDTFSFSGSTLTFDTAPSDGMALEVIVDNLINLQSSNLTVDTFTAADVGGSPQTDFTLSDSPAAETNLIVFVDGVFQAQDSYTISTNVLTMTDGVVADRVVTVYVINPVNIGTPSDGTVTSAKLSGNITMPANLTVTGDVAFDSPTFVVDNANSRVGIGTAAPTTLLDIVGDVKMSADLTVDTNTLYVDSTNNRVGVGTSSPAASLDVTSSASDVVFLRSSNATTSNVYITNTNATTGNTANLYFAPANNVAGSQISSIAIEDFSVSANRTADLAFSTRLNGTMSERLRIDSTGNVGIGTSSPANTLHVKVGTNLNWRFGYPSDATASLAALNDAASAYVEARVDGSTLLLNSQSGGNVGIGTTSPATGLHIAQYGTAGEDCLKVEGQVRLEGQSRTRLTLTAANAASSYKMWNFDNSAGTLRIFNEDYSSSGIGANGVLRMTLDNSGHLFLPSTSNFRVGLSNNSPTNNTEAGFLAGGASAYGSAFIQIPNNAGNGYGMLGFYAGSTLLGNITKTGANSCAYNTSSDYRLKENVNYEFNALERVSQLKPARFNFIAEADKTVDGFIAHEVQDIVPEAIHGTKDEVDEEGNPVYQGIDQSKLVPLLTKAIQEQQVLIEQLQAEVALLKGE